MEFTRKGFIKMKRHQPRHIYCDHQLYFITAHIYKNGFLLDGDLKKDKLLLKIFCFAWEYQIDLLAWVVMIDHYHLLIKTRFGKNISNYTGKIHSGFTFEMNELEGKKGRRLWHNYWDWCIRDECDYWKQFNYIHNNPIKHGLVSIPQELRKYRYSSYWHYIRMKGEDWLLNVFESYPVLDFTVKNDEG